MIPEKLRKVISKDYRIGGLEKAAKALASFSLTERVAFAVLGVVFVVSASVLLMQLNQALTVEVPASGGTLTEGIIGIPRFINPLLAISDADRDLTTLVYSGLMKATTSGVLVPDLADSYTVSPDGLSYTFHLRDDAKFQDGTPVTADDVLFTVEAAQDPNLKSPRRASWEGVTIEKLDNRTLKIMLKQAYTPFLENTTMGILPSHIWKDVDIEQFTFSQFNVEPVGSGPYRIKSIKRSSGGIPSSYTLVPFSGNALGVAHVNDIVLKFYQTEDAVLQAYQAGDIDSVNGVSPHAAVALKALGARVESAPLPRVFAVFFNQNQVPAFTYPEVRQALSSTVDRTRIVSEVLSGYGVPLFGPLPQNLFGDSGSVADSEATDTMNILIANAQTLLKKNGWKPDATDGVFAKTVKKQNVRLEFSVAVPNTPELQAAAKIIKEDWGKIGAKVTLNFFDTGDINQTVIRPRSYGALFFGEVIGRDLDLYAFWDSSQRNDPGLNIALYTNLKADKLLEAARTTQNPVDRIAKYQQFATQVAQDVPAAFIYSPDFIYVVPQDLKGLAISHVTVPSDRFLGVTDWYLETDRVWSLFAPQN